MENNVVQDTVNLLIDEKGFFLEEFDSMEEGLGFYLYTPIKNGYLAVIFSSLGREDENLATFLQHGKNQGLNTYVLNIIFTKGHQVSLKTQVANYSEAYVDESGNFYGLDDLGRSVLNRPTVIIKKKIIEAMPITLILIGMNVVVYLLTVFFSKTIVWSLPLFFMLTPCIFYLICMPYLPWGGCWRISLEKLSILAFIYSQL